MTNQQQIDDLVQEWIRAELHGDVDAYDRLLARDFVGVGPVGFTLNGQQWSGRHRAGLTNHHLEVRDTQARFYGGCAVVTGVQEQRTTARGHDTSGSFRFTLVAVRTPDRWEIVHFQLSGPLQAPTAPPPFARPDQPAG